MPRLLLPFDRPAQVSTEGAPMGSRRGAPPDDAPESDMAGRSIDRLGMTRRRPISTAVIRCAQMRAALEHLARNPDLRITRVVARRLGSAARVFRNAARFRRLGFVSWRVPVGRPFPDIPDHVTEAVAVSRKCGYR